MLTVRAPILLLAQLPLVVGRPPEFQAEARLGVARHPKLPRMPFANWKARYSILLPLRWSDSRAFFLNHGELIDKHFGQVQVHFRFTGSWIWNLAEKQR